MDRVHLLAPPGAKVDLNELSRRVAPHVKAWPQELATRMRRGGGIIAENATPELAAAIRTQWEQLTELPLWETEAEGPVDRPHQRRVVRVDTTLEATTSKDTAAAETSTEALTLRFPTAAPESVRWSDFSCAFVTVWAEEAAVSSDRPERSAATTSSTTIDLLAQSVSSADSRLRTLLSQPRFRYQKILLTLARTEPVELIQVEVGAVFPQLVDTERTSSLDVWLAFLGRCIEHVAPERFLPGTLAFWNDKNLDAVRCSDRQEFQHRLAWIAEILAHELWEPFR